MESARVQVGRVLARLAAIAATLVVLPLAAGAAMIAGVEVRRVDDMSELAIEFSEPVRYLRHSPDRRADAVLIQLEPLSGIRPDVPFGDLQELRRLPSGNPAGVRQVRLEGSFARGFSLEVRFDQLTHFEIEPTGGARQIVVRVHPRADAAPPRSQGTRFAIQVASRPVAEGVPRIPRERLPVGTHVYTLAHRKGTETWVRVRVGFFESRAQAEQARKDLQGAWPDAWVVRASRAEQTTALRTALTPPLDESGARREAAPTAASETAAGAGRRVELEAEGAVDPRIQEFMETARDHLTAGRPKQAIPLLTKLVTLPPHPYSADAKELLGVARERNGQLAHAKAEYEEYLALYPQGDGAFRVRQRLEAMITAAKPRRAPLPESPAESTLEYDLFGTLASYYRFDRREIEGLDPITTDSSLNSDTFLGGRLRLANYDLRSEFSGSYLADFLTGGDDEVRIRTAFLELRERGGPWSGSIGRQSPRGGGIIERYDGARLRRGIGDGWGIGVTGGVPVNIFDSNEIRFDQGFLGLDLDFQVPDRPVSGELFAVWYDAQGFVDRVGVGFELRYVERGRSVTALVDFDAYYQVLNTAFATGFLQLSEDTHANALVDYRNSPILRTGNALIGQLSSNLDRLPLSRDEIERYAEDRTARSTLGSIGLTHRLSPTLQVSGDFSVAYFGSTLDSGVAGTETFVAGTDSFGPDYAVFAQAIANDLLLDGDISVLGIRVQRGDPTNLVSLILEGRYRALDVLRIIPRFDLDHRENGTQETISLAPSLRAEIRYRGFVLEGHGGVFWEPSLSSGGQGDETGFTLSAGIRYNF